MHDLDLALRELEPEYEGTDALEWQTDDDEPQAEYDAEGIEQNEEYELASELLEATSDEEIDHFLGKLFKKATGALSRAAKGPLSAVMRSVAKKALPMLGTAAGTFFGGPAGAALGAKLGSGAGQMFGLELEGLSPEDQELEVARRVVRLASDAAKQLSAFGPTGDLMNAAKSAVMSAAATHAPGLLGAVGSAASTNSSAQPGRAGQSGRWIRRGRRIILLDL
jgi:hypothetical protein